MHNVCDLNDPTDESRDVAGFVKGGGGGGVVFNGVLYK